MQDLIQREITVKAGKEKVYDAIVDPNKITSWFPDKVEGSLLEGESAIFTFTEHDHQARIFVEASIPFEYFSYRWVPGGQGSLDEQKDKNTTLVEFIIEETEGGTKVTLKESGFSKLPSEVAESSFKDNSGGWEYMMGRLESFVNEN